MKILKAILSERAPRGEALWLKPVDGGFAIYVISKGGCRSLKVVGDNGTKTIGDDKVLDLEKPDKFTVVVTTTKAGSSVTTAKAALIDELIKKMGPEIYNVWAEGPLEFDFTEPDDNGKNLTIKGEGLELKVAVGVDTSGVDHEITVGTPAYVKPHATYKNAFLTTYFTDLLGEVDIDIIEAILPSTT